MMRILHMHLTKTELVCPVYPVPVGTVCILVGLLRQVTPQPQTCTQGGRVGGWRVGGRERGRK